MLNALVALVGLLLIIYGSSDENKWRWLSNFILLLLSAFFFSTVI